MYLARSIVELCIVQQQQYIATTTAVLGVTSGIALLSQANAVRFIFYYTPLRSTPGERLV